MDSFVTIEIEGLAEEFEWKEGEYQITNLETPHPSLFINGKKFIGRYVLTEGTELILSPENHINVANKKLVFKLDPNIPNYQVLMQASTAARSGDHTANGYLS